MNVNMIPGVGFGVEVPEGAIVGVGVTGTGVCVDDITVVVLFAVGTGEGITVAVTVPEEPLEPEPPLEPDEPPVPWPDGPVDGEEPGAIMERLSSTKP
jgi:hypothetical protein